MPKKTGDSPIYPRAPESALDLDALTDILPDEVDLGTGALGDIADAVISGDSGDDFSFAEGASGSRGGWHSDMPEPDHGDIGETIPADVDEGMDSPAVSAASSPSESSAYEPSIATTDGFATGGTVGLSPKDSDAPSSEESSESIPVFETSFGLKASGFKKVKVSIDDEEPTTLGRGASKHEDKGPSHKVYTPSETENHEKGSHGDDSMQGGAEDDWLRGRHGNDSMQGGAGDDLIKAGKGEDNVSGDAGDDVIDGGHGNDRLDGGSGSDVVNADKGDDILTYTLGENVGETDYYDGGKGADTLVIKLTADEYEVYKDELNDLADWIAEHADEKRSSSKQFNDNSDSSPAHPVYETSFGLHVRHMEDVNFEITDEASPGEEPPAEEPPEEEPSEEGPVIVVDREPAPSEVTGTITGDGAVPLKNVDVTLAEGSQITFDITVNVEELPEQYDVFMMHDLSGSFWDDLPNVKAQFAGLYESLTADSDVAFGIGSFVDKPEGTFGASYDYVYNTDLAMSTDQESIQAALDGLRTYSGWDWPEAQMEALVQSALRDEEIGFREGSQKFVVLFTDAPYHKEGDYAEAGANDYDTELESEDYPDPAVVGEMLIEAGITPIFAVTSAYISDYQALVDQWGVGAVTELHSDSSNIADAITGGLTEATIDLQLDTLGDDYGFVSSVEPPVYEDVEPGSYTFTVTMEIPEGSESYSSDSMAFQITGYGEVNVDVTIDQVDITGDSTNDTLIGDAGPNGIYGMEGDDNLIGTGGVDDLYGGEGNDLLDGGLADDRLSGGAGNDTFVFAAGSGGDTITDFSVGDILDFRRLSSVSSHAEVLAAATQVEGDTVFDFGNGDSLTLLGFNQEDLLEEDILI